jgi:Kef-type K+ transport system membrane component KefB
MERAFLADLALVLCVAAVTTVVFRRLRQPVVLGYLLAGLIVGPYTPVPLFASSDTLHTLSELGVIWSCSRSASNSACGSSRVSRAPGSSA